MAKQTKNHGSRDIKAWSFESANLPSEWLEHLGDITDGARILIEGDPKNGKTEYEMQLLKAYCDGGYKVNFNSPEQLKTRGLQLAMLRNGLDNFPGKFIIAEKTQRDFETWFKRLCRPNSGNVIALDSADYMNLTFAQYKMLHERFPQKTIIIICWKINPIIKHLKHMQDVIIEVKDFVAKPLSRLGGHKNKVVWDKKARKAQTELF